MTAREAALLADIAGEHAVEQARRRATLQLRSRDRANRWAARRHADRIGATS